MDTPRYSSKLRTYPRYNSHRAHMSRKRKLADEKEEKGPTTSSALLSHMSDYFSNTSLHGFKYIAESGRHPAEKGFWILCCLLAIGGTIYFIYPVFYKYNHSPVIITVESNNIPIWNVDFPAVTICNVNKAVRSLIDAAHTRVPWKSFRLEALYKLIDLLARSGTTNVFPRYPGYDEEIEQMLSIYNNRSATLVNQVKQTKRSMLLKCWWQAEVVDCDSIFERRLSDHGNCVSFNSLSIQDTIKSTPDEADPDAAPVNKILQPIRRVNSAGSDMGLTILLDPQLSEYYATADSFVGFKVLLHSPDDFPYVNQRSFVICPGKEIFAAVSPTKLTNADDVHGVDISIRKCRFDTEDILELFTTYTYENCLLECRIKSMLETCGCVSYIFAASDQLKQQICNYTGLQCMTANYKKFLSVIPLEDGSEYTVGMKCDCPASCDDTSYSYDISSSQFPLQLEEIFPNITNATYAATVNINDFILLRVYFKNLSFMQFQGNIIYTWTDLIASFGGVVGLFLGFSLISGVEVIYFFTVRLCLQYVKIQKQKKQVQVRESVHTAGSFNDSIDMKKAKIFSDFFSDESIVDPPVYFSQRRRYLENYF